MEKIAFERRVKSLVQDLPPLPDFSRFHDAFRANDALDTPEGNIRTAFFLSYDEENCDYMPLDGQQIEETIDGGREVVSASFIIPYPPGFPILVPGQVESVMSRSSAVERILPVTIGRGDPEGIGRRDWINGWFACPELLVADRLHQNILKAAFLYHNAARNLIDPLGNISNQSGFPDIGKLTVRICPSCTRIPDGRRNWLKAQNRTVKTCIPVSQFR